MIKRVLNENFKATAFYMIGNLFDKAIAFLTVPIFTRILSPKEYGVLNTYTSWVSFFAIIVGLSLGQTLRSAYYEKKKELDSYLSSIFGLASIDFVITLVIVLVSSKFINYQITTLMLGLCILQSFMQFIRDTVAMKYMMGMQYVKRTLLLSIPNVVVTLLSILLILNMTKEKYMGRILSYVLVYSVVGACLIGLQFFKGKTFYKKEYWRYGLGLSLPLILHAISCVVLTNSDRIMITKLSSAAETGIYSLVYNMSLMTSVVTSSAENVWIPWFSKKLIEEKRKAINTSVISYIYFVAVLVIVIMFVAPEVLMILAPAEYWSGKGMVPPLMLAVFVTFLYSISANLEYYYKATKLIARNTVIAAVSNIVLNWIFIPYYGGVAAAYTTLVSYTISFVLHYHAGRKLDKGLFPFTIYIIPILCTIAGAILFYLMLDLVFLRWGMAIALGILLVLLFFKGKLQVPN